MALDALAKSRMKAQHRAERDDMADRHASEKRQLTDMANDARKRETEEARKRGTGHASTRVKSAEDDVKDRVAAHAKLKAKQDKEYSDLRARHEKEMESAEKTGKVPAHRALTTEAKKINQEGLSPKERGEYQGIVRHYSNQHAKTHNADEDKKDRLSRYKSSAMAAKMEEARLTHHDEISRKAEQSLANLRRKVEARKGAA
jgi:hypothetical protein